MRGKPGNNKKEYLDENEEECEYRTEEDWEVNKMKRKKKIERNVENGGGALPWS